MKKITFDLNGDNRPYIEGVDNYKSSIFHEQYEQCISMVDSFLKGLSNMQKAPAALASSLESTNNIIVFDGERGSGKTSCMMSVVNMLTDSNHAKICGANLYVANAEFETIQMIEPAFFDKEHNILTLFIARLYRAFKDEEEIPNNRFVDNKHAIELNQKFVEVQRKLRCMFGEDRNDEGLEYLVNMAAAVDLKNDLQALVTLYLKYKRKEDGTLLLMVDDIDLNDEYAWEMAEHLRKYFIQPNIIVMMSMKIRQMFGILQRDYRKGYTTKNNNYLHAEEEAEIAERSERYLAKLLPAHQRIYMPEPASFMDAELEVKDAEKWGYAMMDGIKVNQVIPELIFIKTRYLFYNTRKRVSYIVPRNLRDIRQLLKLLIQMPNYANENETERHPYNKKQFLQYMLNDWRDINLKEEYRSYIDQIVAVKQPSELNQVMVSTLSDLSENTLYYRTSIIENLTDVRNTPYNISVGDVQVMLRLIEDTMMNEEIRKLVFLLKSLYSIRLYEAYDSITSSNEETGEIEKPNVKIQKKEHGITHNDYEAMTAGCLFNADLMPLIPDTMTEKYLTRRKISVKKVSELFEYCIFNWEESRQKHLIDLAELLMLCVHYDVAKESLDGRYRRAVNLCYDSFGRSDQLVFDLGALFFNLTRIERCFNRFSSVEHGTVFLRMLNEERQDGENGKNLLSERIIESALPVRPKIYKTKEERWLSYCCFRNMEIVEDFLDTVRETVYSDRKDGYKTMREFFQAAGAYNIQSYDRDKAQKTANLGTPYEINFKFFEAFEQLFSDDNEEVKEWFLKIYNSVENFDYQEDYEKMFGSSSSE
jgi:hypothetical protein